MALGLKWNALLLRGGFAAVALVGAPFLVSSVWQRQVLAPIQQPPHQPLAQPEPSPSQAVAQPSPQRSQFPSSSGYGAGRFPNHQEDETSNPFCAMPSLAEGQKVVLLGSYEGAASSNLSLAGGDQTFVAEVNVEAGTDPLYVVATSYSPMIWLFTGNVGRVRNVVATTLRRSPNGGTGKGGAGVVGIPREHVAFLGSSRCLGYFYEYGSMDHAKVSGTVTRRLSHEPDYVGGIYKMANASVPSMKVTTSNVPGWQATSVITVDPSTVVSAEAPETMDVLPGDVGLQQLVSQGALVPLTSGHRSYRIVKTFSRFPAGLFGGNLANFVLAKGVDMPGGDPGHSCVISEATGQQLSTAPCMH